MIDLLLIVLFTFSVILIIYHHAGYPVLLKWYAKTHPLPLIKVRARNYKNQGQDLDLPSITILVPAYNEARWIQDKIRNLACLDYPRDKLKIIIVSDGCTDETVLLAHKTIQEAVCSDTHFEIISHHLNRGKVAVINESMQDIVSDIVGLSDVSALISVDALLIAAEHFNNRNIGVVNPCYQLFSTTNKGEEKYWKYQSLIKKAETTLGSTLGSHGAFYLFRRHLFEPLAVNTINDDFILPMQIVKQGFSAHYDPNMIALELEPSSQNDDFKRRLRISAGNMQQALQLWTLFGPRYMGIAFAFFSGKGLRLLTPYLMLACLTSSVLLSQNLIFFTLLILQLTLYTAALTCYLNPKFQVNTLITLVTYLLSGHLANFIGGLRYLMGLENRRWKRVNH